MFDSDSECDDGAAFLPAVLNRPKVANHIVHESFAVDTRDHEDHTFCGVMFDVRCRGSGSEGGAPLDFLEIDAISVRGLLGPLTVWTTAESYKRKEHEEDQWELLYERDHGPSHRDYQKLEFQKPLRLVAGQGCGLYVHSKLPGDDAIVYDNQRARLTYEDEVFQVFPGLAHLSNRPFGRRGMWGFPWRENREFVGRINYAVGYKLWNPEVHHEFSSEFRKAVKVCLLCARRPESPLNRLQDDVVFYILNMCRHDWFAVGQAASSRRSAGEREGSQSWANRSYTPLHGRLGLLVSHPPRSRISNAMRFRPEEGMDSPDGSSDSESSSELVGGIASLRRDDSSATSPPAVAPMEVDPEASASSSSSPSSSSLRMDFDASDSDDMHLATAATGYPDASVGAVRRRRVKRKERSRKHWRPSSTIASNAEVLR